MTFGFQDKGIRIFEFVAKTQFLSLEKDYSFGVLSRSLIVLYSLLWLVKNRPGTGVSSDLIVLSMQSQVKNILHTTQQMQNKIKIK